jgi:hypothetical protein
MFHRHRRGEVAPSALARDSVSGQRLFDEGRDPNGVGIEFGDGPTFDITPSEQTRDTLPPATFTLHARKKVLQLVEALPLSAQHALAVMSYRNIQFALVDEWANEWRAKNGEVEPLYQRVADHRSGRCNRQQWACCPGCRHDKIIEVAAKFLARGRVNWLATIQANGDSTPRLLGGAKHALTEVARFDQISDALIPPSRWSSTHSKVAPLHAHAVISGTRLNYKRWHTELRNAGLQGGDIDPVPDTPADQGRVLLYALTQVDADDPEMANRHRVAMWPTARKPQECCVDP